MLSLHSDEENQELESGSMMGLPQEMSKSDSDFEEDETNIFEDDLPGAKQRVPGWMKSHYFLYLHCAFESTSLSTGMFGIILCLSLSFKNSLVLVASLSLIGKFFRGVLARPLHGLLGRFTRSDTGIAVISFQSLMLILGSIFVLLLHKIFSDTHVPWEEGGFVVLFVFLVVAGTFVELSELLSYFMITTDWMQVMANSKSLTTLSLSEIATTRSRISLMSKMFSPIFFGIILHVSSVTIALSILIAWVVFSGLLQILFLYNLKNSYPELSSGRVVPLGISGERIDESKPLLSIAPLIEFWSQTSFLASTSIILVCFTALTPNVPTLINYLAFKDTPPFEIGLFQGLGNGVLVIGSLLAPKFIEWFGLSRSALGSIWVFSLLSIIGFIQIPLSTVSVWLLMAPLILSQIFYWVLEVTEKQILKESVDENSLIQMQGLEYQLCTIMSLLSFVVAISSKTPQNFIYLAGFSLSAVLLGSVAMTIWFRWYGHGHELSTIIT